MTALRRRLHGPAPLLGRTLLVVQALAALAFVAALLYAEGVHVPFVSDDGYRIRVVLSDAAGLPAGRAPVLVAGVPSGRVETVRAVGGRAVATLRMNDAARHALHSDATAVVEPRSALEDMTLDLRPGSASAPALREGATIAQSRTRATVSPDRVLAILDSDTRAQLAVVLDQLAAASARAPGALRSAILKLRPAVDGATRVTAALDRRRVLLTQLVGQVDALSRATDAHNRALARTVSGAQRTLHATAAQDGALRASVRELPATLSALRRGLADTEALAQPLNPALSRLRPVARTAPATLAALRTTLPSARGLIDDLDALARDGAAPVKRVRSVLTQARPLSEQLLTPTTQLQPIVRAIDAKKDGIGTLGENFGGVLSTNDANGTILRGLGFFEDINPANFGFSGATGARLTRVKADVVTALVQTCLHDNPLACLVRYLVPGLPGAVRK
jgi:phospholipid/cholesterol/gamma-HCH transport system substrate-binding protein